MLQDAHRAVEAMAKAASALKGEQWGEAERALMEVQEITGFLLREVGDKVHDHLMVPAPIRADRE